MTQAKPHRSLSWSFKKCPICLKAVMGRRSGTKKCWECWKKLGPFKPKKK